jgi:hypothetical protein
MESIRGPGSSGNTFSKRLCHFAANVSGTDQYWQYVGRNFQETSFCHNHAHKRQPNMFHTLSHSEFNDPHLRLLIAQYAVVVENNPYIQHTIMSDKGAWAKAIHAYKHVITNYFAFKTVYTWSVSSKDLEDLAGTTASRHNSFKWYNIVHKYKERDVSMFQLSLYFFWVNHYIKKMALSFRLFHNYLDTSPSCYAPWRRSIRNGSYFYVSLGLVTSKV